METTIKNKVVSVVNAIGNFFAVIALGILYIVVNALILVVDLIVFNPVVFWIWSLICPKSAAKSLHEQTTEEFPGLYVGRLFWGINKCFRFMLPWRSKRQFLLVTEFKDATDEQQFRFFVTEEDQIGLLKKRVLSRSVLSKIWFDTVGFIPVLLPFMGRLSLKEFKFMAQACFDNGQAYLSAEDQLYVKKYMQTQTLSDAMLEHLFSLGDYQKICFNAAGIIVEHILANGLTPRLVEKYIDYRDRNNSPFVQTALRIYNEKEMTKSLQKDISLWREYCKSVLKDKNLDVEAQKLMNCRQYLVYTECGKYLLPGAIAHFLSQDKCDATELVIKNLAEGKAFQDGKMPDEIYALLYANPRHMELYLKFKNDAA